MSGEDYIKLPNGKRLYINLQELGAVNLSELTNFKKIANIFENNDILNRINHTTAGNGKLEANLVHSIFRGIKNFAGREDDATVLSEKELNNYLHFDFNSKEIKNIDFNDVQEFFVELLEKANESYNKNPHQQGILTSEKKEDGSYDYYLNGILFGNSDDRSKNYFAEELVVLFDSETIDNKRVEDLLYAAINSNNVSEVMESYYKKTGIELTDAIHNSKLPDSSKEDILKQIYLPFSELKKYNPHKEIKDSQIKNKYYTGAKYDIKYDGLIVTVHNKYTNETSRINLKSLLRYYRNIDNKFMSTFQELDGEILELISKEIRYIGSFEKHGKGGHTVVARYNQGADFMEISDLKKKSLNSFIHELCHAIDNLYKKDGSDYMASLINKFNQKYQELMTKYEVEGHKRFGKTKEIEGNFFAQWFKAVSIEFNNMTNNPVKKYMTKNAGEAFAICLSRIFGVEDSQTKFVEKHFLELIPLAQECFEEIKKMDSATRKKDG